MGFSQHTFSIVAIDEATGQVGSAGATCLTSADCGGCGGAIIISGLIPGKGAMNAQATVCLPNVNLNNGIAQMNEDLQAEDILSYVLENDACGFGDKNERQYGIVTLNNAGDIEAASYTGKSALSFANHRTGINYSIQGNILIGPEVLDGMEQGFLNTNGTLAEKLMAAMQGANIPGADSRCLVDGISSKSAFLRVARVNDKMPNIYLNLNVPNTSNFAEPIDSLQTLFEEWQIISSQEVIADGRFKIYPNPAKDRLYIEHLDDTFVNGSIKIYNNLGQDVVNKPIRGNAIELPALGDSILYYQLLSEDKRKVSFGKVIIQN